MGILKNLKDIKAGFSLGRFLGMELRKTAFTELYIQMPDSTSVYAHLHVPESPGRYPGVVIVPGANSAGTDYDRGTGLRASDIASAGFAVLHYDPSGRGKTGGIEDHWGPRHQMELACVVRHFAGLPQVDPDDIGIFSFSIGIIIATGALANHPMPEIRYLYDWEGPSNKFNITRNDTHKPLKEFPTSNTAFWDVRDAARFIGRVRCGYFRYQAMIDHVQGASKSHAIELLNGATRGAALWTRCNGNPENTLFDDKKADEYEWVPESLNHKGQMLKYLVEVRGRKQR